MKKFLALLLALLLALGGAALAEAAEKKPIQFRDLAWGTSYDEISQQVGLTELEGIEPHSVAYFMYEGSDAVYDTNICYYCEYTNEAVQAIGTVAGVKLRSVALYFVSTPNDDGALMGDSAHTALFLARYRLDTETESEKQGFFDLLTNKLTGLYGNLVLPEDIPDNRKDKIHVWKGDDGAYVSINSEPGLVYMTLWYASGDSDAWMKAASNANIDGL